MTLTKNITFRLVNLFASITLVEARSFRQSAGVDNDNYHNPSRTSGGDDTLRRVGANLTGANLIDGVVKRPGSRGRKGAGKVNAHTSSTSLTTMNVGTHHGQPSSATLPAAQERVSAQQHGIQQLPVSRVAFKTEGVGFKTDSRRASKDLGGGKNATTSRNIHKSATRIMATTNKEIGELPGSSHHQMMTILREPHSDVLCSCVQKSRASLSRNNISELMPSGSSQSNRCSTPNGISKHSTQAKPSSQPRNQPHIVRNDTVRVHSLVAGSSLAGGGLPPSGFRPSTGSKESKQSRESGSRDSNDSRETGRDSHTSSKDGKEETPSGKSTPTDVFFSSKGGKKGFFSSEKSPIDIDAHLPSSRKRRTPFATLDMIHCPSAAQSGSSNYGHIGDASCHTTEDLQDCQPGGSNCHTTTSKAGRTPSKLASAGRNPFSRMQEEILSHMDSSGLQVTTAGTMIAGQVDSLCSDPLADPIPGTEGRMMTNREVDLPTRQSKERKVGIAEVSTLKDWFLQVDPDWLSQVNAPAHAPAAPPTYTAAMSSHMGSIEAAQRDADRAENKQKDPSRKSISICLCEFPNLSDQLFPPPDDAKHSGLQSGNESFSSEESLETPSGEISPAGGMTFDHDVSSPSSVSTIAHLEGAEIPQVIMHDDDAAPPSALRRHQTTLMNPIRTDVQSSDTRASEEGGHHHARTSEEPLISSTPATAGIIGRCSSRRHAPKIEDGVCAGVVYQAGSHQPMSPLASNEPSSLKAQPINLVLPKVHVPFVERFEQWQQTLNAIGTRDQYQRGSPSTRPQHQSSEYYSSAKGGVPFPRTTSAGSTTGVSPRGISSAYLFSGGIPSPRRTSSAGQIPERHGFQHPTYKEPRSVSAERTERTAAVSSPSYSRANSSVSCDTATVGRPSGVKRPKQIRKAWSIGDLISRGSHGHSHSGHIDRNGHEQNSSRRHDQKNGGTKNRRGQHSSGSRHDGRDAHRHGQGGGHENSSKTSTPESAATAADDDDMGIEGFSPIRIIK